MRTVLNFRKWSLGLSTGFLVLLHLLSGCASRSTDPASYVDPFIATADDHGQLYPGATVPFGMVKLSPDTYPGAITGHAHAGYDYNDSLLLGFSHVRIGGMGCRGEGGNILVAPRRGRADLQPQALAVPLLKSTERAEPGYYTVETAESVRVELTCTAHVGFHRYAFRGEKPRWLLLDLGRGFTPVVDGHITMRPDGAVLGRVVARHNCGRRDTYAVSFAAEFRPRPVETFGWRDSTYVTHPETLSGPHVGLALRFAPGTDEVLVKVALSAISPEQALKDLHVELPGWNFAAVRKAAWREWNQLLSRVEVEGQDEDKTLFYTGLYRACTMPFNTTSSDGTYRGTDGHVHTAQGHVHYDTYSIWDTFRTKYPLLSLVAPDYLRDIVRSLVDIYRDGRQQWPFLDVRHEHTGAILLDAYRKGITDFDVATAYEGMKQDALAQLPARWEKLGYVPERPDRTLEAAYDDWCVAEMARLLGRLADAARFSRRAGFYRNVWDDSLRFFRARDADGNWLPFPADPTAIDEKYVYEGSMWQWRWFVLHDVPGLIRLFGGPEAFVKELRTFFDQDLYNHGNQPDLHAPFLFNFAGAPHLTQDVVYKILTQPVTQRYGTHGFYREPVHRRIYRPTPDGFIPEMDDDCGTMWAWYVLGAMGLYQVCPGNPVYQITTPVFRKVVFHLDAWGRAGKTFRIERRGTFGEKPFIQEARLNGRKLERMEIPHSAIVGGGELVLEF